MQTTTSRPASGTTTSGIALRVERDGDAARIVYAATGNTASDRSGPLVYNQGPGSWTCAREALALIINDPDATAEIAPEASGTETRERWVNVEKPLQSWQGLVVEQTDTEITLDEWTAWHMGDNRPTYAQHGETVTIAIDADTKIAVDEDDEQVAEPTSGTEHVEARELRDTDVLVNPENGETIPVRLVAPHNGLILVWTDAVNAFAISPTATIAIKRRTETIKARDLRQGDAVKGLNDSFGHVTHVSRGLVYDGPVDQAPVIAEFGGDGWGSWSYRADDTVEIARRNGGA